MSSVKTLLDSLLWDIYGEQRQYRRSRHYTNFFRESRLDIVSANVMGIQLNARDLDKLGIRKMIDVCAILKVEIRLMVFLLERILIARDRNRRHQDVLCGFVDAILHVQYYDAHPKMRFSLSPPPPKAIFSSTITSANRCSSEPSSAKNNNNNTINSDNYNMQRQEDTNSNSSATQETSSDYKQWLHAMKLVARLPGGIPPEFRRKLWLSLADKYLKSKNVDWSNEQEKCFCAKWREDDEELGIQIVKDLHRTGSTLCTGPAGDVNQAKLKRILLGYARYNPEVGYCQGFNMLGALILQVMDKEESESIKVMIYLVEGILPTGYFCGSMGGLQADMAVFRELMQTKLPRLAKHLQKLQGPIENAYEPPLTNVFTMQWFLTMFCTCLPMSCVLRVWDLVLIEGSDVLLRTALALWSLLEERVLSARSADDFYGKMGSFSSELLNGHLIDSNGLIEKVVQLGPISDIQKLREKHLYNIAPLRHQQGLHLYYDDDEPDMDEDSRLAVATVWGVPWGRRGSQGHTTSLVAKPPTENKDRIALDISLLKKQYDRLRERQKQAHIILTTACSTARQSTIYNAPSAALPVNQLLSGRPAIVTNKGRRSGPPSGAIPPARKPSLPVVLHEKPLEKHLRRGETLHWRDAGNMGQRRDSLTWKEIKAERNAIITSGSVDGLKSQKIRTRRLGKSDSSSYSEESDDNDGEGGSSPDTSLCDEENQSSAGSRQKHVHVEKSQKPSNKLVHESKKIQSKQRNLSAKFKENVDRERPKSWAPSNSEIPFVLMNIDSPNNSADENHEQQEYIENTYTELLREGENSATESNQMNFQEGNNLCWKDTIYSPISGDLAITKSEILPIETDSVDVLNKSEENQVSPLSNKTSTLDNVQITSITVKTYLTESTNSLGSADDEEDEVKLFDVSDEGVTNEYFERVNSTERPTKLDLLYSFNEEESIRDAYNVVGDHNVDESDKNKYENEKITANNETLNNNKCMDLLVDYSEKSSAACIAEAKTELSQTLQTANPNAAPSIRNQLTAVTEQLLLTRPKGTAAEKRRNPRRLTLTRSSTMDIEKRYQALEKRLSMEISSKRFHLNSIVKDNEIILSDDTEIKQKGNIEEVPDTKRKIPSTADLEERFKNMQLHLVADRTDKITSPCDSENTGQEKDGHSRKTPAPDNPNERNMNGKKMDQIDRQEKPTQDSDKSDAKITKIRESDLTNNPSTGNDIEQSDEDHNMEARSSPNDTESKFINDKSNLATRKKEPPDNNGADSSFTAEEIEQNSSTKKIKSETLMEQIEATESNNEKVLSVNNRNSIIDTELSKVDDESTDNAKGKPKNNYSSSDSRQSNAELDKTHKKSEKLNQNTPDIYTDKVDANKTSSEENNYNNSAQRKSPPSTEELEKRFSALEKQMSVTNHESNEAQRNLETERVNKSVEHEDERIVNLEENKEIAYEIYNISTEITAVTPLTDMKRSVKDLDNKSKTFISTSKEISEKTTKRRLSEPPSTEDLEKRYEVLKRRMSSRNFELNHLAKGRTLDLAEGVDDELLQSVKGELPARSANTALPSSSTDVNEQENHCNSPHKNSPPSTENLEKRYEELQSKKELNNLSTKQTPPSTENVEKRFEELQNKSDKNETNNSSTFKDNYPIQHSPLATKNMAEEQSIKSPNKQTPSPSKNLEKRYNELQTKNETDNSVTTKEKSTTKHSPSAENLEKHYKELQDNSKQNSSNDSTMNETNHNKAKHIEEIEARIKIPVLDNASRQKRTTLIDELQTKIKKANASGEHVKPSSINPGRKPPAQNTLLASQSFNDETSETHATSAYNRSGKYEPRNSSNRKMVRRFSDLPSRADLENRLQFLEEQLSKTLSKQRRSSDSEVASKHHRSEQRITLSNLPLSGSLEYRVQELEKHFKENRTLSMDVECKRPKERHAPDPEIEISQIADTIAVTGKELVRYSQFGEVGEFDHQSPINISINIQMTLNKDDFGNKKTTGLPKPDELDRRLHILEQQLKTPQLPNDSQLHNEESKSSERSVHANENSADSMQTNDIKQETESTNKTEYSSEIDTNTMSSLDQRPKIIIQETNQKFLKEPGTDETQEDTYTTDSRITDNVKYHDRKSKEKNDLIKTEKTNVAESPITDDSHCNDKESKAENECIQLKKTETKTTDDPQSKDNREKDPEGQRKERSYDNNEEIQMQSNEQIQSQDKCEETHKQANEKIHKCKSQQKEATETKITDDPQSNDNRNKVLNESKEYTTTPKNEVTETLVSDNLGSNDIEIQMQNESQCETPRNQVNDSKNKQNDSEIMKQSNDVSDITSQNMVSSQIVPIEVNKKTLVLLLDNEPKAVKVRRLTRANTEELEDLFQALERQLSERSQDKSEEGIMQSTSEKIQSQDKSVERPLPSSNLEIQKSKQIESDLTQAMADLTKEIQEFSKTEKFEKEPTQIKQPTPKKHEDEFDWGIDPIKYHLKKRTVYLPSTKELEARFRSLERQIKLLEDVEKIDVEQRLIEIERKIKLQYSLSHEKDLNKFLELCEGKGLDDISPSLEKQHERKNCSCNSSSPKHTSPRRSTEPKHTSTKRSTEPKHTSPKRSTESIPSTGNLEYRYRALDLKRSMSKQNLKREPIHPLEMLLDPSPDDSNIPTTGELEHRMRMMEEQRCTPSPPSRKSRSQSPPQQFKPQAGIHRLETMVTSPAERELPTAEELEARLEALEKEQRFDFKMQKNYQQFNQKLKDIVSPSPSFDEYKPNKSSELESKNVTRSTSPKPDAVSPKTIRFRDEEYHQPMHRCDNGNMVSPNNDVIQILEENSKIIQRILKKTIADSHGSNIVGPQQSVAVHEGLGVMGIRLMRETSPLRRKGTHTGVPLRTGENINDQLTSIKNTIKSIDSLCEEKPYRKERCQQYIDALFSDSTYFAAKKSSLEDLTTRNISRSSSREIGPSIRISDHSPAFSRSMGSADSIRSSSPLRPTSPLQYRSNRDLRREPSPRRRRDEDREEHESRTRTCKRV